MQGHGGFVNFPGLATSRHVFPAIRVNRFMLLPAYTTLL
jgi:hypothetical protein